jgi:hypothetical protein
MPFFHSLIPFPLNISWKIMYKFSPVTTFLTSISLMIYECFSPKYFNWPKQKTVCQRRPHGYTARFNWSVSVSTRHVTIFLIGWFLVVISDTSAGGDMCRLVAPAARLRAALAKLAVQSFPLLMSKSFSHGNRHYFSDSVETKLTRNGIIIKCRSSVVGRSFSLCQLP